MVPERYLNCFPNTKLMQTRLNKRLKYKIILMIIFFLALVLRLYFFNINIEADIADEGEYLVMARSFSQGEIVSQWPYYRPFLLPMFFGFIENLGFGIFTFKAVILIFSLISVILIYLIGKDLFNENTGLIAAFLITIFPDEILHSSRILINSPALTMWLLSFYLFQKAYFKKSKTILYLSGLATGLAILMYTQNIILIPLYIAFLLVAEGTDFIKNKKYILFIALQIIVYLINLLYSYIWFDNPLKVFGYGLWLSYIDTHSRNYISTILNFIIYLPNYLSWTLIPFIIAVPYIIFKYAKQILNFLENKKVFIKELGMALIIIGIFFVIIKIFDPSKQTTPPAIVRVYAINSFITIIILIFIAYVFRHSINSIASKMRNEIELKKNILVLFCFIFSLFGIAKIVGAFQARYFMPTVIPLFLYLGGIFNVIIKKKKMFIIPLVLLLSIASIINFNYSQTLTGDYHKATTFGYKEIGLNINKITNENNLILGPQIHSLVYYSSRNWYWYPNSDILNDDNYKKFLITIKEKKPGFVFIKIDDKSMSNELVKNNPNSVKLISNYTDNLNNKFELYKLVKIESIN